jgi:hypothetical protein
MPKLWMRAGLVGMVFFGMVMVQPSPVLAQTKTVAVPAQEVSAPTPKELGETQEKLMTLLRLSPTLAQVVSADPSLLGNQEYVSHIHPELAQFLQQHPEIARSPAFYLFSNLREESQKPYQVLKPKEGFEREETPRQTNAAREIVDDVLGPFVVMVLVGGACIWLIRTLFENRRWSRIFRLQGEVHGKLIERFGSSQELLTYMQTDAGKRFLEAAPIATELDQKKLPNMVSRVLTTLQIGVVLTLLGIGLMYLRRAMGPQAAGLLILGVVVLMPGLGCILSAAMTWVIAGRLGLLRDVPAETVQGERQ